VVFDLIPDVTNRYGSTRAVAPVEIWKFNRQVDSVRAPVTLRVLAEERFMLRWTLDEWRRLTDTQSTATGLALDFVDIEVPAGQSAPLRFTFFWLKDSRWEGCDFRVSCMP